MVFVHEAGGNHLSWWNQIPHFSQRYRCVTYEVRGWGQSPDLSDEDRPALLPLGEAPRRYRPPSTLVGRVISR